MDANKLKQRKRWQRAKRTRSKLLGVAQKPRLTVFRSNKHVYAQLIDDQQGKTIVSVSDLELKETAKVKKMDKSKLVGQAIAKKALDKKITEIIFDKGGYKYHGAIKSLAEGAREGGLKF